MAGTPTRKSLVSLARSRLVTLVKVGMRLSGSDILSEPQGGSNEIGDEKKEKTIGKAASH
jgi:hypothetical protein